MLALAYTGSWDSRRQMRLRVAKNDATVQIVHQTRTTAFLIVSLGVFCLSRTDAGAQSATAAPNPVFTVSVPAVSTNTFTSTASFVSDVFGDTAGNTLYVLTHTAPDPAAVAPQPPIREVGIQWLLVPSRGQPLATTAFPTAISGVPIKLVSFSSQRILAQVDEGNGVIVRAFDRNLRSAGLAARVDLPAPPEDPNAQIPATLTVAAEVLEKAAQKPPAKFFDIAETAADGKVVRIRRFDSTKLQRPIQ